MASAHSLVRNYNEFIPPIDLDFMVKAMAQKQQQYDQNYADLQGQIDAIGAMDLAKDADRQYLYEKTQSLVREINMSGQTDLSSKGVARQISNHIKQALDENVVNGLQNTAAMRRYQAEVAEIKKSGKGEYSLMNEVYGFIPIQMWLEDGQVGTSIQGNARYIPYTDVQKKYVDFMKEMERTRGTQKFTFQDPSTPGRLIEREFRGLKPEEVRTVFEGMLSPQDRQQLVINGWYNFGRASPDYAKEMLKNTSDVKLSEYDGKIKELNLKIKGATGQTKTDYESTLDLLTKNRKTFQDNVVALSETGAENIGAHLEKERLIGGLVEMHKYEMKSEEWKSDAAYWEDANYKLKEKIHRYNVDKDEKEAKKAPTTGLSFINAGTPTGDFTPPDPIELADKLDKGLDMSVKDAWLKASGMPETAYQSLVKSTEAEIEKSGKDLNEAMWEKWEQLYGRTKVKGVENTIIRQQIADRQAIKKVIKDAEDETNTYFNSPEVSRPFIAEIYDNNVGVQVGSKYNTSLRNEWDNRFFKENGRKGSRKEVLEYVERNPELIGAATLQATALSFLKDYKGSEEQKISESINRAAGYKGVIGKIAGVVDYYTTTLTSKPYHNSADEFNSIVSRFNEKATIFEYGTPAFEKKAPKTAAYLKALDAANAKNELNGKGKSLLNVGRSIETLPSFKKTFNPKVREQKIKDAQAKLMKNSPFDVGVGVSVESPLHTPLANLAALLGLKGVDKDLISVIPTADGALLRIARTPTEDNPKPFSAVNASRDDLQRNGLLEVLNLEPEAGQVNQSIFVPQRIQVQPYFDLENARENETAQLYIKNKADLPLISQGYAKQYLNAQVPDLATNFPKESAVISQILDDPSNVVLETSQSNISGNTIVTAVYTKDNKELPIGEISYTPAQYNKIKNAIHQTPQLILTSILEAQILSGTPSKKLTEIANGL